MVNLLLERDLMKILKKKPNLLDIKFPLINF